MSRPAPLLKGFERKVAEARPVKGKIVTISDPDTRGLYVRVMASGMKSFNVIARDPQGKQRWVALGDCDVMGLKEARAQADEVVRRIKAGQPAKDAPPAPPETFPAVLDNFLQRHVDKKALRTGDETKRIFRVYVSPTWKDKPFAEIKRGDVARLLDTIEDENGPVMADRVLAALSKLFNWYASREDDYSSPIARGMGRSNGRERARVRILTDDEIRSVWKSAKGTFGACVKTLLLTGQRRAKVAGMKWDDIADGIWTIPAEDREKTNAGQLKLSALTLDIIKSQPELKSNPHVFAGRGDKAIAGFSPLKRDLDKDSGVTGWVLHDLRRTAKSLMARAGVRPDVSERVLGHVIAGVEGVYDRHSYADEKADALEKLAGLVGLILNPPKGNVVSMKRKAS